MITRHEYIVRPLMLLLASILLISLCIVPLITAIQGSVSRFFDLKELTSKTEVLRKDRSKLVETNKQLKTEIERIKPENNTGNGVSSLYSVINGLATKTNIRLLSLKPGKEINTDKSIEIPFELTVSDKYHKIGLFINQIENNGGLCKVDKVIISGHKTGEHTVDAAINLSFFKIK